VKGRRRTGPPPAIASAAGPRPDVSLARNRYTGTSIAAWCWLRALGLCHQWLVNGDRLGLRGGSRPHICKRGNLSFRGFAPIDLFETRKPSGQGMLTRIGVRSKAV
jgi:hypothetical protein